MYVYAYNIYLRILKDLANCTIILSDINYNNSNNNSIIICYLYLGFVRSNNIINGSSTNWTTAFLFGFPILYSTLIAHAHVATRVEHTINRSLTASYTLNRPIRRITGWRCSSRT